jgi:hydrogen peroxide-dependent heme synthase
MSAPVSDAPSRPAAPAPAESVYVPPALTLEGWYAHHQLFSIDRAALRRLSDAERHSAAESLSRALETLAAPQDGGWTAPVQLVGSAADLMIVHFRPSLDAVGEAQRAVLGEPAIDLLRRTNEFLSVTEAGMYALAVKAAKATAARGGIVGDAAYHAQLAEMLEAERASAHVQKRLYPPAPTDAMPYVCFYPMSKKREAGQNWYALTLEERSRLMWEHGKTGRRYAGKVFQIVTGSIGFDAWEWGVTLLAADPLEFKRIVTEMRFDEVSARYGEFGPFYVGRVVTPEAFAATLLG